MSATLEGLLEPLPAWLRNPSAPWSKNVFPTRSISTGSSMTRGESIYPSCSAATNDMKTDDNAVRITLDQQGEERCAKLAGSITIDSSPELRRALLRMLKTTG